MKLRTPRLLPLTIAGMAALLIVKCAGVVLAAAPAAEPTSIATAPIATTPTATAPGLRPARPAEAPPAKTTNSSAMPTESEQGVLSDLRRRRDALDAREARMQARESVLDARGESSISALPS